MGRSFCKKGKRKIELVESVVYFLEKLYGKNAKRGSTIHMKQIPNEDEYSKPYQSCYLRCTDCNYLGKGVRRLKDFDRNNQEPKFYWLCPKCFKKVILGRGREEVEFT